MSKEMSRTTDRTREKILEAGFHLFFREGYARASMDMISAEAGITKRTLYNHFDSKDQLLDAVLASQTRRSLARFQDWTSNGGDTIAAFLEQLFAKTSSWANGKRWRGSGFTRLSMELADLPGHPARRTAARHKASVEKWMAGQFRLRGSLDPLRDARILALILEGALSLTLISGNRDYILDARWAALRLLAAESHRPVKSKGAIAG